MNRLATIVVVAAAGWIVRRLVRASRMAPPRTSQRSYEEDCRLEECGPDGTPLSLYAG